MTFGAGTLIRDVIHYLEQHADLPLNYLVEIRVECQVGTTEAGVTIE